VLAVERQYGPTTVADEVTMWCRDSGEVVIGGERISVQVSPGGVRLDVGDLVVAPLWRNEGSGKPLPADQYWLYAEPTLFIVDSAGVASRAVANGPESSGGGAFAYALSELEAKAAALTGTRR